MKRDLNFFAAYKNGPAKTSGKSNAGLFLLIAIFIFIISGTYGGLFLYQKSIQLEINMIKAQVGDSSEKQQELAAVIEKNELLKLYTKVLADSKGKFDSSIFINKQKLTSIASAMPSDVRVISMKMNPQNVQLTCVSKSPLGSAQLQQALDRSNLFSLIWYDGVTFDEIDNNYHFIMTCNFNEVQKGKVD
ncbi:MAG TPA: hypothetical protein DEB10_14985 [Ruminococcaceae bacterium]|nr:hypothetical protein [Oscillospiraceae bacterium]HCA29682.1 hypothetical protein [Oscillospiraceae bacterium]